MKDRENRYHVEILTKESPDNFRGPKILRQIRSFLSEDSTTSIGSRLTLEQARKIAEEETLSDGFINRDGKKIITTGVVVTDLH